MNQRRKHQVRTKAERLARAARALDEVSPELLRILAAEPAACSEHPDFKDQLCRWAKLLEDLQTDEPESEEWQPFQLARFSDDPEKHKEILRHTYTDEVWKNNRYQVNVRAHYPDGHIWPEVSVTIDDVQISKNCVACGVSPEGEAAGLTKCQAASRKLTALSIKRIDKAPIHDWRDLQRIKNEICGPEMEAVELYPAESRLVDTSNQFWLWVFPAGHRFGFGYQERLVMEGDDFNVRQRPFDDPEVKAEAQRNRDKLLSGAYDDNPAILAMKEKAKEKES